MEASTSLEITDHIHVRTGAKGPAEGGAAGRAGEDGGGEFVGAWWGSG